MKSALEVLTARDHTLATGSPPKTVSVVLVSGCTSRNTAFQPGCNVSVWVICCACAGDQFAQASKVDATRQPNRL